MIDRTNFAGLDGFVWWVGVIEDRIDPSSLGRCRVRIIGWHTEDKTLLPTEDLPWAQGVYPLNAPPNKSFTLPTVGSWVLGFFMDGHNAQFPVMLGVIPGIKQE